MHVGREGKSVPFDIPLENPVTRKPWLITFGLATIPLPNAINCIIPLGPNAKLLSFD